MLINLIIGIRKKCVANGLRICIVYLTYRLFHRWSNRSNQSNGFQNISEHYLIVRVESELSMMCAVFEIDTQKVIYNHVTQQGVSIPLRIRDKNWEDIRIKKKGKWMSKVDFWYILERSYHSIKTIGKQYLKNVNIDIRDFSICVNRVISK